MKGFVDLIVKEKRIVWNKKVKNTRLDQLKDIIEQKYSVKFESYFDFHEWTVKNYEKFWVEIWKYFDIIHSEPYHQVFKKGSCILDAEWFIGAKLNYAENLLKHRNNNVALLCVDEEGNEEQVTYNDMYEQTKLYAASLRKLGVKKGDRVACYMSNRKEAYFAMLAATSVGAMFGGPNPFFGAKGASDILNIMNPKVLFAIDCMKYNNTEIWPMNNLKEISESVSSLKKIIIVPTKQETLLKNTSDIKNNCFLSEFLELGKDSDGSVPELTFEQLPYHHPVSINFTSGTTGLPKGIVQGMSTILGTLRDFGIHCNLDHRDVVLSYVPVGWDIWFIFNAHLMLGNMTVLYDGNPFYSRESHVNFWDFVEKYKISYVLIETCEVDKMEKHNVVPKQNCNLNNLKMVAVTASPVKPQNIEFFYQNVKSDMFVASFYGGTETTGLISGFDLNLPLYSGELQVPALGVDLKCLDDNGKFVLGQIGELVVPTPLPTLPITIWNDKENRTLQDLCLSELIDGFKMNDKLWMDPDTKGFVIVGRSDDVIKQNFERFIPLDVYSAIHDVEELADYICTSQTNSRGQQRAVLFLKMKPEYKFCPQFLKKICDRIEQRISPFHIPEVIVEVKDIPYNFNGKKLERLVRAIISSKEIPQISNVKNPQCLSSYLNIPELLNF